MILETIDFTSFYKYIKNIFTKYFSIDEVRQLMEYVEILADANFRCYRANMIVIATRKTDPNNHKTISEMEWVARNVGEYRVSSKAGINQYISMIRFVKDKIIVPTTWMSDDIVYSIGDMLDRLSIEIIKREDFVQNNRPAHMIASSQKLSDRVERYLRAKLYEIDGKGFYECVHEQRTYDLEGIVKELAL
jgi:hypothetical protein